MKSFDKLLTSLRETLRKHPKIHYRIPANPTEQDLWAAAFVIEDFLTESVVEDSLQDWLDSYRFYQQQRGLK